MTDLSVNAEFIPDPVIVHYGEPYQGPGYVKLWGYVCGYEDDERYSGPDAGGWLERIPRSTFEEALRSQPDAGLLWNFDGLPLARIKSGTMTLTVDDTGLYVGATVDGDVWNTHTQRIREDAGKIDLGDLDLRWGLSFRVQGQTWDGAYGHRTITELELRDIGIIVVPADVNVRA